MVIPDASIPDTLIATQMRRQHHVVTGPRNRLHNREIAVRPAFLKTQINQRRAEFEMVVAARNLACLSFALGASHDDKMPVLLVA